MQKLGYKETTSIPDISGLSLYIGKRHFSHLSLHRRIFRRSPNNNKNLQNLSLNASLGTFHAATEIC
jgi:hypothetical protein